jgi:hypothetical protein
MVGPPVCERGHIESDNTRVQIGDCPFRLFGSWAEPPRQFSGVIRIDTGPGSVRLTEISRRIRFGAGPSRQPRRTAPRRAPGPTQTSAGVLLSHRPPPPPLTARLPTTGTNGRTSALGKQSAAHSPQCSAGYPGRSRKWLRPLSFSAKAPSEPSPSVPSCWGTAAASKRPREVRRRRAPGFQGRGSSVVGLRTSGRR